MDSSRLRRSAEPAPAPREPGLTLAHKITAPLREGASYLASRPGLQLLLILVGFLALFGWPVLTLLPALTHDQLQGSAADYNGLLSHVGVGALVSALVVASAGSRSRTWGFLVLGVVLAGLGELGLGWADTLPRAGACCLLVGFGLVLVFATAQSRMQLSAAHHNRGVIMGFWSVVLSAAQIVGVLVGGRWADRWGTPVVLLIQGVGTLTFGGLVLALALRFPPEQSP
jgi:predicted MFS family arabinose efflux permease